MYNLKGNRRNNHVLRYRHKIRSCSMDICNFPGDTAHVSPPARLLLIVEPSCAGESTTCSQEGEAM
jgi:hypothetical protein